MEKIIEFENKKIKIIFNGSEKKFYLNLQDIINNIIESKKKKGKIILRECEDTSAPINN